MREKSIKIIIRIIQYSETNDSNNYNDKNDENYNNYNNNMDMFGHIKCVDQHIIIILLMGVR